MPNASWIPSLVWTDYRIGILCLVLLPVILLIWAAARQAEAIQRLLIIYWRVSSLLAITVYLLIGAIPLGFLSGWLARILIPLGLWYWADLNEEIREQPKSGLKTGLMAWRWAASIYCGIGVLVQLPVLRCAFSSTDQILEAPLCRVWLQAPWAFREYFHHGTKPWFLASLGIMGLVIYALYLGHFVFFRLGKRKRSAI
jgi:Protein of unknown function (DUF3177)